MANSSSNSSIDQVISSYSQQFDAYERAGNIKGELDMVIAADNYRISVGRPPQNQALIQRLTAQLNAQSAAQNPTPTPQPQAPSPITLQQGMTDNEVLVLQQKLNYLGLNTGGYDSSFGRDTDTAVKAVQLYFGIHDNGVVGNDTINEIDQLIQERNNYLSSGNNQADNDLRNRLNNFWDEVNATKTQLSYGMTDKSVVVLQQKLNDLGLYTGGIDGNFKDQTQISVRAVQRACGLPETGVVDTDSRGTWFAIQDQLKIKQYDDNAGINFFASQGKSLQDARNQIVNEIAAAKQAAEETAREAQNNSNQPIYTEINGIKVALPTGPAQLTAGDSQLTNNNIMTEEQRAKFEKILNTQVFALGEGNVSPKDVIDVFESFGKGATVDTIESNLEGFKGLLNTQTWSGLYDIGKILWEAENGYGQEKEAALVIRHAMAQQIADGINEQIHNFKNGDPKTQAWYIGRAVGEVGINVGLIFLTDGLGEIEQIPKVAEIIDLAKLRYVGPAMDRLTELMELFKQSKFAEVLTDNAGYLRIVTSNLKNVENFRPSTIAHIFEGDCFDGVAKGFHYEGLENVPGRVIEITKAPNRYGVYEAKVEVNGVVKTDISTLFPKHWSPQQVIDAINEAYSNKAFKYGNRYIGKTRAGFEIQMFIDGSGKIISAFPIY